jgi:type II secretory pathway pseudopilin PulG
MALPTFGRQFWSFNKAPSPSFYAVHGFSLLEPVVAAALMAVIFTQIASLFNSNLKAIAFANSIDQVDRDIHLALDVARQFATKYNWCENGGTPYVGPCNYPSGSIPSNAVDFYVPPNAHYAAFQGACLQSRDNLAENDPVTKNLYSAFKTLSEKPEVNGVKITFEKDQNGRDRMDSKEIHRFKMFFEKDAIFPDGTRRTLKRGFYVIPNVALWCP